MRKGKGDGTDGLTDNRPLIQMQPLTQLRLRQSRREAPAIDPIRDGKNLSSEAEVAESTHSRVGRGGDGVASCQEPSNPETKCGPADRVEGTGVADAPQ